VSIGGDEGSGEWGTGVLTLFLCWPANVNLPYPPGCIFISLFVECLLPVASLSTFLHDRHFFQGEHAAGIYPSSAYFAANVTLEVILNSLCGFLSGTITYYAVNLQAFVHAENPLASAMGYVGIVVILNLVVNVGDDIMHGLCRNYCVCVCTI